MEMKVKKAPKATGFEGFGIVNPYGDMWTTDVFRSPEAASEHLADFWRGSPEKDLSRYRIVKAKVRTSFVAEL